MILTVNSKSCYIAEMLVFDKDGLMFESKQFWIELANARMRYLAAYCSSADLLEWAKLMGVQAEIKDSAVKAYDVCPTGILAVASPLEETTLLAGFLTAKLHLMWHESRQIARDVFELSDRNINLQDALKPQPGFLKLMQRINKLGIPYGVATSDTYERTRDSMSLFGCWENVRFTVTPEDVAKGKPEPDMLQLISEKQHISPELIVMIGDSYVDVKMAKAAGCIGIGVTQDPDMQMKMAPYASEIIPTLEMIEVSES